MTTSTTAPASPLVSEEELNELERSVVAAQTWAKAHPDEFDDIDLLDDCPPIADMLSRLTPDVLHKVLTTARLALRLSPIVGELMNTDEELGHCGICGFIAGHTLHDKTCPKVVAGLIDREGNQL